jgi:hypothetical protein
MHFVMTVKLIFVIHILFLYLYFFVVEKLFFVSTRKAFKQEYQISNDGRSCDLYPTSYFSAYITPSSDYSVPLYIYSSKKKYSTLTERKNNSIGTLVGYFYASKTWRANTSEIFYTITKDTTNGEYISEFQASPPDRSWPGKVVYVKNHEVYEGRNAINLQQLNCLMVSRRFLALNLQILYF